MGGKFGNRNKLKAPLERLDRSHRRLEERLEELRKSSAAISDSTALARNWLVVADVLAYLERAAMRHEEDEEESVFPRLQAHPALRPMLDRLRGDHQSQRKLVQRLAKVLADAMPLSDAKTADATAAAQKLAKVSAELQANYLDHIKREDHQLLPAIHRHISAAEQAKMATEMAARRQ